MITLLKNKRYRSGFIQMKTCKPFVENSRGVLIHRPVAVNVHKLMGKYHMSISYACGNTHCGSKNFTFLDVLDESKIVCARCEERAIELGYQSSREICGGHVHTGGVKAVKNCCR